MAAPALVPAHTLAPDRLRQALCAAFADYLAGPFEIGPEAWPAFLARQGVDLALSRVALGPSAEPLAFALVAPRPRRARWRLATMGALPAARGQGIAVRLLDDTIHRATAGGLRALELEVFDANAPACRLYRRRGFEERHALYGHEATAVPGDDAAPVHEVDLDVARAWLQAADDTLPDLPLQVTEPALAGLPPRAWQIGSAQLVFSQGADGPVVVRSLVDLQTTQHDARRLVDALLARLGGEHVRVPQLQRDDLGGDALRAAGFTPLPLHQWLMVRPLAGR